MTSIFSATAPHYYAKGMSVIPLDVKSKKPTPTAWADYASHPIPEAVQQEWLLLPRNHNIGLVLGSQSGVAVIDIDTIDPLLHKAILDTLPKSVWERVGKKGCVMAFKHNPKLVSFRIKSKELGMIVEYLSMNAQGAGTQVVLPPSIHPDTGMPYTSNCNLYDVVDQLEMLPDDIELKLRQAIEGTGVELNAHSGGSLVEHIPAGFRDSSITEKAGVISHEIVRGKISLKKGIELLYGIEANFTEQVVGDAMDMDKHVRNLIKFVKKDLNARNSLLPKGWDEGLSPSEIEKLGIQGIEEEWSYEQIEKHFEESVDNDRDSMKIVKETVLKLAQITNPDALYEARVLNCMVKKASLDLKLGDLKKELAMVRDTREKTMTVDEGVEVSLESHTQIATAVLQRMTDEDSSLGQIRVENGILYRWMGSHYEAMDVIEIKNYIATRFNGVELLKRNSDIDGVYKQVLVLAEKGLRKDSRAYVNVANGIFLENGKFLEHHPDFGATYCLPYRYMLDTRPIHEKMPLFYKFLNECWGHRDDFEETLAAFQEALCATFLGYATKFQKAFLLIGLARSGKSVLLEIIGSLFPEQAKSSVSFNRLQDGQMFVSLDKKLINIIGELSEKAVIAGDIFKSVVDGSPISARRLYSDAFTLRPICAHWGASNHLPKTHDSSEGFTRRWLMFVFDRQVEEERVDIGLASRIIQQEREAIFSWSLEALERLLDKGRYTLPKSHKIKLSALACQTNPVLFFLSRDHNLSFGKGLECTETDLYFQFRNFYRVAVGAKRNIDMSEFRAMMLECLHGRGLEMTNKVGDLNTYYTGVAVDMSLRM